MSEDLNSLSPRLAEIVMDFGDCVGREKLEYLLELGHDMPELPARYAGLRDPSYQVHACMTPVYVYAEQEEGRIFYYFDVPEAAPVVRGFASIMHQSLDGIAPDQVLAIPDDFHLAMGLQGILSGQRINGLSGLLRHLKQLALATVPSIDEF